MTNVRRGVVCVSVENGVVGFRSVGIDGGLG